MFLDLTQMSFIFRLRFSAVESTEPELQRDEEMLSKVAQAKKDSSKLKDLVRFLRKRFVQEYGSA